MVIRSIVVACFLVLGVGCSKSQLDDKPVAKVEPAAAEAPAAPKAPATPEAPAAAKDSDKVAPKSPEKASEKASAVAKGGEAPAERPDPLENAARALVLNQERSTVGFVGRKVTADQEGTFADIEGSATLQGYLPTGLKLTVKTGSVVSGHPDLTNHLKNADFFNAAKYPVARFVSTKVRPGGEGAATHTITGELSLLAVTKRITFPATIVVTDAGATGVAEFKINRKDFGIVYPGRPDDLIRDEVLLKLNLAFIDEKYAK